MLDKVRKPEKAKNFYRLIGYSLMGLICLSFVFVGLTPNTSNTFSGGANAAIVNSQVISLQQFEQAMERSRQQMGEMWNQLPAAQRRMFEDSLRQRVLNELISTELLYQQALATGFQPSNEAVRSEIVELPYFQEDGRFSQQKYRSLLQANRLDPARFEDQIRMQITLSQTSRAFSGALKAPSMLRKLEGEAQQYMADIKFVEFFPDKVNAGAATDAEVKEYLADDLYHQQAKTFYDTNAANYQVPEQVRARHILVKFGEGGASEKDAEDQIKKIQGQVTPKNFADLAKKFSQDAGSKDKGGNLDYFARGRMVPEFEEAAFRLGKGEISGPVKTQFGYHLIYVEDKKAAEKKEFEDVKSEIARSQIQERRRQNVVSDIQRALASETELEAALRKYNLNWESTGKFSLAELNVPKLGEAKDAVIAALRLNTEKVPAKLISAEGGRYIVVKPAQVQTGTGNASKDDGLENSGIEALNAWAMALRDSAKVEFNSMLVVR